MVKGNANCILVVFGISIWIQESLKDFFIIVLASYIVLVIDLDFFFY